MGTLREERSRRGLKTTLDAGESTAPLCISSDIDRIVRQTNMLDADTQVPELTLTVPKVCYPYATRQGTRMRCLPDRISKCGINAEFVAEPHATEQETVDLKFQPIFS